MLGLRSWPVTTTGHEIWTSDVHIRTMIAMLTGFLIMVCNTIASSTVNHCLCFLCFLYFFQQIWKDSFGLGTCFWDSWYLDYLVYLDQCQPLIQTAEICYFVRLENLYWVRTSSSLSPFHQKHNKGDRFLSQATSLTCHRCQTKASRSRIGCIKIDSMHWKLAVMLTTGQITFLNSSLHPDTA